MDEKYQPVCTLHDLYTTSAPIFANGVMHVFGIFQCTSGVSMMLVAPSTSGEVKCPMCGEVHLMRDSFIPMSLDEFITRYQLINPDDHA
jgi:predicted RNA-binding Zn-ribbon protein involved in translation (DUF1610 family)